MQAHSKIPFMNLSIKLKMNMKSKIISLYFVNVSCFNNINIIIVLLQHRHKVLIETIDLFCVQQLVFSLNLIILSDLHTASLYPVYHWILLYERPQYSRTKLLLSVASPGPASLFGFTFSQNPLPWVSQFSFTFSQPSFTLVLYSEKEGRRESQPISFWMN